MNLKELGINPARGGCAIVCSGQVIKNGPWSFTDEKNGEYKEGYSFHVAYFGGVLKVATNDGDPLRKLAEGTSVDLLVPCGDSGRGMRQSGPATVIAGSKGAEGRAA